MAFYTGRGDGDVHGSAQSISSRTRIPRESSTAVPWGHPTPQVLAPQVHHQASLVRQGTTRLVKSVRRVIEERRMSPDTVRTALRHRLSSARLVAAVLDFRANNIAEKEIRAVLAILKVPVLLVLVTINLLSGLYLLLWSLLLFSMNDVSSRQYGIKRKLSGVVFLTMSILHFHELVTVCGHDRRRRRRRRIQPTSTTAVASPVNVGFMSKTTHAFQSVVSNAHHVLPTDAVMMRLANYGAVGRRAIACFGHCRRKLMRSNHKYDAVHMARHVLVTVTTSLHAHHMSLVVPAPATSFLYAMFVALNCSCTPVLCASKNAFIKMYLTLLLDAMFHFVLSVGFPLVVFWPTYLHYMRSPVTTSLVNTTYDSIAQNLLIDHLQTFNTVLECATAIVLHVSNHLSVHYLAKMALTTDKHRGHRASSTKQSARPARSNPDHQHGRMSPLASAMPVSSPLVNDRSTIASIHVRPAKSATLHGTRNESSAIGPCDRSPRLFRWLATFFWSRRTRDQTPPPTLDEPKQPHHFGFHRVFVLVSSVWAATLVVGASSAFVYTTCPVGCSHRVSEWFRFDCSCRDFTLTCTPHMTATDVATILNAVDANLFLLSIVRCNLPTGLPPGVIGRFHGLYLLSLDTVNLTTWDEAPSELTSNLQFLRIRRGRFRQMPRLFESLPATLITVAIEATPLATIPLGWTSLLQLEVWGGNLTTFPSHVTSAMAISLFNNSIREIPAALPRNLQRLDLRYNNVDAIPPALFAPPSKLALVDLSYNRFTTVPDVLLPFVYNLTLGVAGTPLCATWVAAANHSATLRSAARPPRLSEICFTTCASGCEPDVIGDSYCDAACYNETCGFDKGDCDVDPIV
ncbi:hypothetical protein H310_12912 [Aphanomyces invadans]|uniref:LNR domain-containing protein n=1 Tax=Aphanomyces invadans TaxID=157072 RepID=A0A024TFG0_9STRA|nr:hypothetical protein H310_12912 [Aphanomyces invadans]ETV92880.1 hypothetical protein H310_12912 [Aphanomyces invadans]|eukprot:XP_008878401.1 hypothetical protein H310_12912 [Aphanomyces invadans]